MSDARERPENRGNGKSRKDSGSKGKHAKRGFPGKLQAARTAAPADATNELITDVAWVAYRHDREPADVWAEWGSVQE